MYAGLGENKATTILAAIANTFCAASVLSLEVWRKLREMSALEAEKRMRSVAKEVVVGERGERAEAGLGSCSETLVEDQRRGDVEAVVADMAERGESQRAARIIGRIIEIYGIQCLPSE
jgi:hypothetical protein